MKLNALLDIYSTLCFMQGAILQTMKLYFNIRIKTSTFDRLKKVNMVEFDHFGKF
jgi:hypothetical protein